MLEPVLAFLFGLLIGSFLNVCIYRMPRDLSVARPRSFCPVCERPIAWYDNIPLLSYVLLAGKCRHCRAAISLRYPAVELLTGLLLFSAVRTHGIGLPAAKLSVFGAILVALVFSDFEERILPDEFTLGGLALGVLSAVLVPLPPGLVYLILPVHLDARWLSLGECLLGALLSGGSMWLVGKLYHKMRHREGLGFGDVKMVAMMGAFLGVQNTLLVLILGSLGGSLIGLAYIFLAKKDAATYQLPFGSFLGAAAILVAFFGKPLIAWYLRLGG